VSLAFHAAPPDGDWLNDPNALIATPEGFRLLAQHRGDSPHFAVVDWGSLSSRNMLDWHWEGIAIHASPAASAYSGSLLQIGGRSEIFHTVHEHGTSLERQVRLVASDASSMRWYAEPVSGLPGARRNLRDPFVFQYEEGWRMLLAASCDWRDWRAGGASELRVFASDDLAIWREAGRIGPWHDPGVMWEVPALTRQDGRDLLFVSTVDRRGGGADCGVRAWSGRFDGATFHRDDPAGSPVDLGPDFYAMIPGSGDGWPGTPPFVGWLASWNTAREPVWPGFSGGPISLPRVVKARDGRVTHEPLIGAAAFRPGDQRPIAGLATAEIAGGDPFSLTLTTGKARLLIEGDPRSGLLRLDRVAGAPFTWRAEHRGVLALAASRTVRLFVDGPAIELFLEPDGLAASVVLPGHLAGAVLEVDGRAVPLGWSSYDRA
jgi:sucrose-6-phosphate hydrolase SacC (GH32 family)